MSRQYDDQAQPTHQEYCALFPDDQVDSQEFLELLHGCLDYQDAHLVDIMTDDEIQEIMEEAREQLRNDYLEITEQELVS